MLESLTSIKLKKKLEERLFLSLIVLKKFVYSNQKLDAKQLFLITKANNIKEKFSYEQINLMLILIWVKVTILFHIETLLLYFTYLIFFLYILSLFAILQLCSSE